MEQHAVDRVRLARAVHLTVHRVGPGRYRVEGGREPHLVEHTVCNCVDDRMRHGACKHRLAVGLRYGNRQLLRALRDLVPKP